MSESLPPGPGSFPIFQVLRWLLQPVPFMHRCERRYGRWFTLRFPGQPPFVFTSDSQAIREIFNSDSSLLHAGAANVVLRPLLGDHSLLLLEGAAHLSAKRLMLPAFHGERMQTYALAVRDITDRALALWPPGKVFSLQREMQSITLETILRAVLGLQAGPEMERLRRLLARILNTVANPLRLLMVNRRGEIRWRRLQSALGPLSPWGRTSRLIRQVDQILYQLIGRSRTSAESRDDILALLVQARDESGRPMSDNELRDQLMTLLVAGHETTATALAWVFAQLFKNPECLDQARCEVDEITGRGPLLAQHIPRLSYLEACIREALRLTPVIPLIGRVLQQPASFGNRLLPSGIVVAPCVYLAHRQAEWWEQPEGFSPRRFLHSRPRPSEFFPFGGGARYCLGAAFALYEMKVVVAQILSRVELEPAPGYRPRIVRRSVTLAPSQGLPARLVRRR